MWICNNHYASLTEVKHVIHYLETLGGELIRVKDKVPRLLRVGNVEPEHVDWELVQLELLIVVYNVARRGLSLPLGIVIAQVMILDHGLKAENSR